MLLSCDNTRISQSADLANLSDTVWRGNRKRPVIGREPSGPFSEKEDRRILAAHSVPAPHRLCSRDDNREIVGHRLENLPRSLGSGAISACLDNSTAFGCFGLSPSPFQNGLLRKPLVVPHSATAPKGGLAVREATVHVDRPLTQSDQPVPSHRPRGKRSACPRSGVHSERTTRQLPRCLQGSKKPTARARPRTGLLSVWRTSGDGVLSALRTRCYRRVASQDARRQLRMPTSLQVPSIHFLICGNRGIMSRDGGKVRCNPHCEAAL